MIDIYITPKPKYLQKMIFSVKLAFKKDMSLSFYSVVWKGVFKQILPVWVPADWSWNGAGAG